MKTYQLFILLIISVSCAISKSNQQIYWVNSTRVPCEGVGKMQCLQVQKGETLNWKNWTNLHTQIEGFEFEPGYIYKLIVREEKLKTTDIPADASSIRLSQVKVLEKNLDSRLKINNVWILENIRGKKIRFDENNSQNKKPQIEFDLATKQVKGNDGCNNFFGGIKSISPETIEFTPFASTKMACMGTDIPDRFNPALFLVSKYKIENSNLLLLDKEDNVLLVFLKK